MGKYRVKIEKKKKKGEEIESSGNRTDASDFIPLGQES